MAPCVLSKAEISLVDAKIPQTGQPYHVVMDLPWPEAERAVKKFARAIEKIAAKALARILREQQMNGVNMRGVGIAGAPDRELMRIGNPHIRAHAAEGVLFRHVLQTAAEANGLSWRAFSDRDFTRREFGSQPVALHQKIKELGRTVSPPWRTYEKEAAMAAWLVLHGKSGSRGR